MAYSKESPGEMAKKAAFQAYLDEANQTFEKKIHATASPGQSVTSEAVPKPVKNQAIEEAVNRMSGMNFIDMPEVKKNHTKGAVSYDFTPVVSDGHARQYEYGHTEEAQPQKGYPLSMTSSDVLYTQQAAVPELNPPKLRSRHWAHHSLPQNTLSQNTLSQTSLGNTTNSTALEAATTSELMVTKISPPKLKTQVPASPERFRVGDVDAQEIYPPEACLFVANLNETKDDTALEAGLTRELVQYGNVYLKLRRDSKGMPYAFAQFHTVAIANAALRGSNNAILFGRPLRVEHTRGNRVFIIYRKRGGEITINEAREVLEPFGELSKCEFLNEQLCKMMGLPGKAVLVEFTTHDPNRNLKKALRGDRNYHVDSFDLKKGTLRQREDPDHAFLRQYEIDRRSIFVGNLPARATEETLREHFEDHVGQVQNVCIIDKNASRQTVARRYAFVEFVRPDLAENAIVALDGTQMEEATLKIERKFVRERTSAATIHRRLRAKPTSENLRAEALASSRRKPVTSRRKLPDSWIAEEAAKATGSPHAVSAPIPIPVPPPVYPIPDESWMLPQHTYQDSYQDLYAVTPEASPVQQSASYSPMELPAEMEINPEWPSVTCYEIPGTGQVYYTYSNKPSPLKATGLPTQDSRGSLRSLYSKPSRGSIRTLNSRPSVANLPGNDFMQPQPSISSLRNTILRSSPAWASPVKTSPDNKSPVKTSPPKTSPLKNVQTTESRISSGSTVRASKTDA